MEDAAVIVEHLAHVDAMAHELGACRLDVVDHKHQLLTEPGSAVVTLVPKTIAFGELGGVSCNAR
jgi:hypothetical protein